MKPSGILIAGPARCGKSTVSGIMSEGDVDYAVLTVDALFPAFIKKHLNSREESVKFLREYLLRPRYMNPEKTSVRSPADDMGIFFEPIIAALSEKIASSNSATGLISSSFEQWAAESGKEAWLAPDLHAELYFQQLISDTPDLQIIVLLRDPCEAIAASLYWRTYPERMAGGWRTFAFKLFLWCLSAETGRRLVMHYPENARVVFIDDFSNKSHSDSLSNLLSSGLASFNNKEMYFSYDSEYGWLGPDGQRSKLLSHNEKVMIESICYPWFNQQAETSKPVNTASIIAGRLFLMVILLVARLSPGKAKTIMEWLLFPEVHLRRTFMNMARRVTGLK